MLDDAIADRFHITILILGDTAGTDVIASRADVRAQALSSTRQVVWLRDAGILTDAERKSYTNQDASNLLCVLDLDDNPVAFLRAAGAESFTALERAFLKGQGVG